MKMRKILVVTVILTMLLVFPTLEAVHAQVAYGAWVGKWFRMNDVMKGYTFDGFGIIPDRDRVTVYLRICNWNDVDTKFTAELWVNDGTGIWVLDDTMTVNVHTGTPLDFLAWIFMGDMDIDPDNIFAYVIRVKGRENTSISGEVKTGNFKSLGGLYWEEDNGHYHAGGEMLKGVMTPATNLPFTPPACP